MGMYMKFTTALAIATVCLVGTACSQPEESSAAPETTSESAPIQAVDTASGKFNLPLPASVESTDSSSGRMNLNLGGAGRDDGLIIGGSGFGGGSFGDDPVDPTLDIFGPQDESTLSGIEDLDAGASDEDDGLIRLP